MADSDECPALARHAAYLALSCAFQPELVLFGSKAFVGASPFTACLCQAYSSNRSRFWKKEKKEKNVVIINNKKLFLKIRIRKSRHRHTRNKTKHTDGCDAGRHVFIKAAFCLKLCTSSLLLLLLLLLVVLARAGAVAAAEAYDFMLELVVGWVLIE